MTLLPNAAPSQLVALLIALSLLLAPAVVTQSASAQSSETASERSINAREETPVDIPASWRDAEEALELPPPLPNYTEMIDGNIRWLYPSHALKRESEALRDALPRAWRIVADDLGLGDIPPLHIRLALNPEHLRQLSPRRARAPEFAVGVAYPRAGIILVSLSAEAPATNLDPEKVLIHELSHVALRIAVDGRPLPRWFVEGLAIHHAEENHLRRITTLFAATARGEPLDLDSINRGFSARSHQVNEAYAASADLVRYLRAQAADEEVFTALLAHLREGHDFETALRMSYGFDLETLERAWLTDLRRRFPRISLEGVSMLGFSLATLLAIAAGWKRIRRKKKRLREMAAEERLEEKRRRALDLEAQLDFEKKRLEAALKLALKEEFADSPVPRTMPPGEESQGD